MNIIDDLSKDELEILNVFVKEEICNDEQSLRLSYFVDHTGFTKYKVTKLRKSLASRGYLCFCNGLVREDSGGYFGSGYFLNDVSLPYVEREFDRIYQEGKR